MTDQVNKPNQSGRASRDWPWLGLILLAGLGFSLLLIQSRWFASAQYEEANPGLIALEAMKGNFYPIYWGDYYGGTLHAFVSALFFKLLGPSMLVFRLSNYFWWMLFLVLLYLLGREIFGRKEGLWAAALMAIPPAAGAYFSVMGWTGYVANLPVGAALLWLVCLGSLREPSPKGSDWLMLLAGVMAGILVWIHLVGLPFVAAGFFAAFWARPGRFIKRDLWLMLLGGLAGAAPLIGFIMTHGLVTDTVSTTGSGDFVHALRVLFLDVMPQLLGAVPVFLQNVPTRQAAWWLSMALGLGLGLFFLRYWLPRAFTLPPMAGKPRAGMVLLLAFLAASLGAWFLSPRAGDVRPRYLHVLSVFLPLIIAQALCWLGRWNRFLPALGLAGVLVVHGLGLYGFAADKRPPADAGQQEQAVVGFLLEQDCRHFYAHLRVALPLTFMSWGKLVGSDFFGCQSAAYLPLVDGADRVAVVTHDQLRIPHPGEMRRWLTRTLNSRFKEKTIGGYTVFYDLARPKEGMRLLPRQGWRMRAGIRPDQAGLALDGDIATRWQTGAPQEAGQWLELDLGAEQEVNGLLLLPGRWVMDGPARLAIEGSRDGIGWRELSRPACLGARWMGPHPVWREAGPSQFMFPVAKVRYLRMRILGPPRPGWPYHWSLAELYAYGPERGGESAASPDAKALYQALAQNPPPKVLASDHLAAKLTALSNRRLTTQLAYAPANSRAGCGWHVWPNMLYRERSLPMGQGSLFALSGGEASTLEQDLGNMDAPSRESSLAGLKLIALRNPKMDFLKPEPSWRSHGQGKEAAFVFLSGEQRWTPGLAQAPGQALTLDLGRSRMVSGLVLSHGKHTDDYPRALGIMASADGKDWQELEVSFSTPQAWWSGQRLLNDRSSGLISRWPGRELRYLRLELKTGDPVMWWSVTGLKLIGAGE